MVSPGSACGLLHQLPHHVVEDAPMCMVEQLQVRVKPEKQVYVTWTVVPTIIRGTSVFSRMNEFPGEYRRPLIVPDVELFTFGLHPTSPWGNTEGFARVSGDRDILARDESGREEDVKLLLPSQTKGLCSVASFVLHGC